MEIEYKAEYKSDADRVKELLEAEGYRVRHGIIGLLISKDDLEIAAVLEPDVDIDNATDFYVGSNNANDDGYLVMFTEGYPQDERYEICRAVRLSFEDEERFINSTQQEVS